jgi:hypothetical protein
MNLLKKTNGTFGRECIRIDPFGFISGCFGNRVIGPAYEKRNDPA